jgi:hypothetical protein
MPMRISVITSEISVSDFFLMVRHRPNLPAQKQGCKRRAKGAAFKRHRCLPSATQLSKMAQSYILGDFPNGGWMFDRWGRLFSVDVGLRFFCARTPFSAMSEENWVIAV